ncbi:MAG: C1 family peptidase [Gemmataceae bacterium]
MSFSRAFTHGMGWIPDWPDPRDYTSAHDKVQELLASLKSRKKPRGGLPKSIDLCFDKDGQQYCAGVEDQGYLNCSSACAVLGLVEYFERRVYGHTFEGSSLFLYKMARNLRRTPGDCGVDLRTTLKALIRFGVPPVELWLDDPDRFDDEPSNLNALGFIRDFENLHYLRLDPPNNIGEQTLQVVKSFLAAGFPVAFGFSVPRSISIEPDIPYRPTFDSIRGGQAVVAVGYDNSHRASGTTGAIRIRNSWGNQWGDNGHGWLPYECVKKQLASDFWTILREDWTRHGDFHQPHTSGGQR